jgi:hypothetical protein
MFHEDLYTVERKPQGDAFQVSRLDKADPSRGSASTLSRLISAEWGGSAGHRPVAARPLSQLARDVEICPRKWVFLSFLENICDA